ncbi:MAG: phospholipase [Mediterranea sp.]|jgi:hypothetical protein|nr:phospholipase [Mediterranea sp.]
MWVLVIALFIVAFIALMLGYIRNKNLQRKIEWGELDHIPGVTEVDVECCGRHQVCEKDKLLTVISKKIEYYDDEELDNYIGVSPDEYTAEQTDQFRDIFYTMQDIDVAGWVRSLQIRGICLPDEIKDEVFLIIGERRKSFGKS